MPAWIPVVLVVSAIGVYAAIRLFGGKGKKKDLVAEAKAEAKDIKAAADAQLEVELKGVDDDRAELGRIKKIENDEARLAELARFGNRRRA